MQGRRGTGAALNIGQPLRLHSFFTDACPTPSKPPASPRCQAQPAQRLPVCGRWARVRRPQQHDLQARPRQLPLRLPARHQREVCGHLDADRCPLLPDWAHPGAVRLPGGGCGAGEPAAPDPQLEPQQDLALQHLAGAHVWRLPARPRGPLVPQQCPPHLMRLPPHCLACRPTTAGSTTSPGTARSPLSPQTRKCRTPSWGRTTASAPPPPSPSCATSEHCWGQHPLHGRRNRLG